MNPYSFLNLATQLLLLSTGVTIHSLESSISCDFEDENICGYTQDTSDNFDWTRLSGPTASLDTGPENDHTFRSSEGNYMYIEASSVSNTQTARLISTVYQPPPQPQCLEFWYHMHGAGMGTLRVYFQQNGRLGSPKFKAEGNHGNIWRRGEIDIHANSPAFQVVFEGVKWKSHLGDIAIDDVAVRNRSCASNPAGPDDVVLFPKMLTYSTMEGSAFPDVNCSCIGCIPGCNVIWSFNGVGIGNNSTLQLSTVNRFSSGTYTCACVNPSTLVMKSVSFDIDVKYGPTKVVLSPATTNYIIEEGKSLLDIECSCGLCSSACQVYWLYNNTRAGNHSVLKLHGVRRNMAGKYACHCVNPDTREEKTSEIKIFVEYGPDNAVLTPNSTVYSRTVGSHVESIDCSCGDCYPSCTVKWTQLGKVISNVSVLDLGRLSMQDTGEYVCVCLNNGTSKEATSGFQLTVKAVHGSQPCQEATDDWGTTWNSTVAGDVVTQDCKEEGYIGTISRECLTNGQWEATRYDCVRDAIAMLGSKLETISKNISKAALSSLLNELANITKPKGQNVASMYPKELQIVTDALDAMANLADSGQTLTDDQSSSFMKTASNLMNKENVKSWKSLPKSKTQVGASKLLQSVDTFTGAFVKGLNGSHNGSLKIVQENIVLEASKIRENQEAIIFPGRSSKPDSVPTTGVKLSLPLEHQSEFGPNAYAAVLYNGLADILPNTANLNQSSEPKRNLEINTAVVSLQVFPEQKNLPKPLEVTFERLKVHYRHGVCSYWNFEMSRWDTDGCWVKHTTDTHVVCECSHLTNFAVLMSPWQEPSTDSAVVEVISVIGCSLSIFCLLVTTTLHILLWRYVKNDRAVILLNISVALIATYVIFLAGINRTDNQATCKAVAALLHYILLVVFCLMLAEGVEITVSVKYVFQTKSRLKWMLPLSWGVPALIVGISMGISRLEGYGTTHFCWLSVETGVIWAFVGPAMVIIVVNLVFLGILLRTMLRSKAYIEMTEIERIKSSARCLCVLVPLMGGTWVLGIFYVNEGSKWIQYVFAICNSLQGFFIFVFHCLLNKQMHNAIKSRHKMYKDSHSVGKGSHSVSKSPSMKRSDITVTRSLSKSTSMKRTNVTGNYLKKSGDTNADANSLNTSSNMDRAENSGIMNPAYVSDSPAQDIAEQITAGTLAFPTLETLEEEQDKIVDD